MIEEEMKSVKGVKHIRNVLLVCSLSLIYYTLSNLIIGETITGLICGLSLILVSIDTIYIIKRNRLYHKLILSVFGYISLCLLLMFIRDDANKIGRMWALLIPLFVFYTQTVKKSIIILSLYLTALLIKTIIDINLDIVFVRLNIEQLTVFIIISISTWVYAMAVNRFRESLNYQLYYNKFVKLPNRVSMLRDIKEPKVHAVILINMDGFKRINSLYGTDIGDKLIYKISRRIQSLFLNLENYKLYKLHADEFCLLINKDISQSFVVDFSHGLINKINNKIDIDLLEIYPTFSIGISHGFNVSLENADMALKQAKELNKDVVLYSDVNPLVNSYIYNQTAAIKIKKGVENRAIFPEFQPIISLKDDSIYKYEALVRLKNRGSICYPNEFLGISKEIKQYKNITFLMIEATFEYFKDKKSNFSINLDNDDLTDIETTDYIIFMLKKYNIAQFVTFEILETKEVEDMSIVVNFINVVKSYGCKIAIDDFGSGYSNFAYLLELKADYLKIDASLIKSLDSDKKSYIITKGIISLAKDMGIKTIAEYVHNNEISNIVKELGVDFAQGFLYGKPKPYIL